VRLGTQALTYQALDSRSNQIANFLLSKGVQHEDLIGVCLERSIDMIVAILGILKCGGAYVPLDPAYPQERINYLIQDTQPRSIVTAEPYGALFRGSAASLVLIDAEADALANADTAKPAVDVPPTHLAYVMYTSGSTGQPKGVLIHHQSIVRLIFSPDFDFLDASTVMYQYAPVTFDASTFEIWGSLLRGGTLAIGAPGQKSLEQLAREVRTAGVNTLWLSAGLFHAAVDNCIELFEGISYMLSGGDSILPGHVAKLLKAYPGIVFINGYGPTESTTFSAVHTITALESIDLQRNCIGKPIGNTQLHILNPALTQLPVGAIGEIYLAGDGLARGYLNQPQLTAEKFVQGNLNTDSSTRLYKSGDLGRWLADGRIEYLGRVDEQVKIRGYRVELGEIESTINQLESVSENCVVVQENQFFDKTLVDFFVPDQTELARKEVELSLKQIEHWELIYQKEYSKNESHAKDFNITGWMDSFTNQAIPAVHMREWLADIARFILSRKPQNVLEIGCGTGLIYYQLAAQISKYIGADLSQACINELSSNTRQGHYPPTQLYAGPAHKLQLAGGEAIDTIIINSVIQYFPGQKYLRDILSNCLVYLNGSGQI
ncbi:MAG TPA: amino acid adenylation domain-containing protein, partial [Hymenobacter sp.]|nr:amino acid adenylation domain-containing protein [Hymenobacter sp.]